MTVQVSAALGSCTLGVLAQSRQIMFNVLLVLGIGFPRSLIINTENRAGLLLALGKVGYLMWAAKSLAEVRKGDDLCASLQQQQVPMQALLKWWSDSQVSSSLCPGTQNPAQPADASCPLPGQLCEAPCPALHQHFLPIVLEKRSMRVAGGPPYVQQTLQ